MNGTPDRGSRVAATRSLRSRIDASVAAAHRSEAPRRRASTESYFATVKFTFASWVIVYLPSYMAVAVRRRWPPRRAWRRPRPSAPASPRPCPRGSVTSSAVTPATPFGGHELHLELAGEVVLPLHLHQQLAVVPSFSVLPGTAPAVTFATAVGMHGNLDRRRERRPPGRSPFCLPSGRGRTAPAHRREARACTCPGTAFAFTSRFTSALGLVLRRLRPATVHRDRRGSAVLSHRLGGQRHVLLLGDSSIRPSPARSPSRPASRSSGPSTFSSLPLAGLTCAFGRVRGDAEERLLRPHREDQRLVEPRR